MRILHKKLGTFSVPAKRAIKRGNSVYAAVAAVVCVYAFGCNLGNGNSFVVVYAKRPIIRQIINL